MNTLKNISLAARRVLFTVVLIVLANGLAYLVNIFSGANLKSGAWKVLIVNTLYFFLVWIICRPFLSKISEKYPNMDDTRKRIILKITTFLGINAIMLAICTYGYYVFRVWEGEGSWLLYYFWTYGTICFFGSIILAIYEGLYLHRKWTLATKETEQLKHEHLQTQLASLKNQVNPHFLFNSLNSLSSLIEEDEELAQVFIHELAHVYRYLLQSNERTLTDLKSELAFIEAYFFLLKTRFDAGISLHIDVSEKGKTLLIPPLTLQLLLENAVKHNIISPAKTLKISIYTEGGHTLVVSNNLQVKTTSVISTHVGLNNIKSKYRLLSGKEPTIEKTETHFKVTLPLLEPSK